MGESTRKRIAVVGSGVAGLAATWLLNEHSDHDVYLYEADSRPGGHANTVLFSNKEREGSEPVYVDTGFIVFNPPTYPNFLRFLQLKHVPFLETEMSFSVSRDRGAFEWAGRSLSALFSQAKNIVNPDLWRLVWDILRFNACAREVLWDGFAGGAGMSIGDYLAREGYSKSFRDNYLLPMTSAIWSTPADKVALDFPAKSLVRFMHNHHLLQIVGRPSWLTIKGGSQNYLKTILSELPEGRLKLGTPVRSLSTIPSATGSSPSVELETVSGDIQVYDHVILACHSDASLDILENGKGGATTEERAILGCFKWSKNEAVLHSDIDLLPVRRAAWSSWNYLTSTGLGGDGQKRSNVDTIALTYNMNILQHISEEKHGLVLVTLNPPFEPHPSTVVGRWQYDHPEFSAESVLSQSRLAEIQNTRSISYIGAWTNYGFHEDGFTSGMKAALALGAKPPFEIKSPDRESLYGWMGPAMQGAERVRRLVAWELAVLGAVVWLFIRPMYFLFPSSESVRPTAPNKYM